MLCSLDLAGTHSTGKLMYLSTMICFVSVLVLCSCKSQSKLPMFQEPVRAYIKRVGLDSISREDFLREQYIRFNRENITITKAVVHFYQGPIFTNSQTQPFTNNRLPISAFYSVINAKNSFKVRVTEIHYIDGKGKKGEAPEFSFIVY